MKFFKKLLERTRMFEFSKCWARRLYVWFKVDAEVCNAALYSASVRQPMPPYFTIRGIPTRKIAEELENIIIDENFITTYIYRKGPFWVCTTVCPPARDYSDSSDSSD
jgi:hypothetical protein